MVPVLRSFLAHPLVQVALMLLPSSASAEGLAVDVMQFQLPASNGYTMQVRTEGSQAAVTLWRGDRAYPTTYYAADAVEGSWIHADLGQAGRIDVQFEPSGARETVPLSRSTRGPAGCRTGGQVTRSLGTFTGTIEFSGEGGYSAVVASHAAGSVGPPARKSCGDRMMPGRRPQPELRRLVERVWVVPDAVLIDRSRTSNQTKGSTLFLLSERGAHVEASAYRLEWPAPGLVISRSAGVDCPPASFSYPRGLSAAVVRPPAPFGGEARYLGDGRRIVGNLTVDFPGLPRQPLSGPEFEARIRPLH